MVGGIAVHGALSGLHRALVPYARGLTPGQRERLEYVLVDLETAIEPDPGG